MIFYSPCFIIKNLQKETFKKFSLYLKGRILDLGCGIASEASPQANFYKKRSVITVKIRFRQTKE